ncbi:MAG: hypothetical protein RDU13_12140 [Elusimicrobiales bacterium]|jgi:hypothetical protein|nr:hypothetical protein [Elusimicrobiales bacterium]
MKLVMMTASLAMACACGPKPQEKPPVPKDPGTPAPSVAVATAAPSGNPMAAPANYVKRTTDQIGGAKAAASLYEDTAAKRMDPNLLGGE